LLKDGERWETREVQVGASNDSFMTIKSGLSEGENVVLNPRAYAERLELPYIPDPVAPERSPEQAGPQGESTEFGGSGPGGPGRGGGRGAAGGEPAGSDGERSGGRGPAGGGSAAGGPGSGFDPTRIFSMLDTDGDGTISAEELAKIPEEQRARMAANDLDGDGAVSRDEFAKAIAARGGGNPGSRSEGNGS
jgi:hypothetical protein